ncbi:hypothetical protein LSAT2_018982, partial [Lamellibrachia satsuma]
MTITYSQSSAELNRFLMVDKDTEAPCSASIGIHLLAMLRRCKAALQRAIPDECPVLPRGLLPWPLTPFLSPSAFFDAVVNLDIDACLFAHAYTHIQSLS